ncbi:uncharacterized protein LOC120655354 [Panicum virgatum]|uniref:uncharacterized protein LOC120655354 n=1 Tax=Panicum virgatum TaxID=38727 RepID=UPI0019D51F14|nr:uncharacterized protein LOC120655354 [Panicum virgatum]XP_039789049.1 uncharacterized protein LOC120655354 [Panicum virgatum]
MPEVQALMNHAKEKISSSFAIQSKKSLLKRIMAMIECRWEKQMDHPLYGAALYLNPGKLHPLIRDDADAVVGQLRGCFLDVLARMVEDEETRLKINAQAMNYEYLRGDDFSNKMAKENLKSMGPFDWWRSYGGRAIELQRFARRVVSLCASSSGCERNWSTFEFIHTKKRNRLLHKRLNSIAFVSYNRKMKSRFQKLRLNRKIGIRKKKTRWHLILWLLRSLIGTMNGPHCMWPLKVLVGVSVTLLGILFMKPLEHLNHFMVDVFQEQAAATVLEILQ